jgi:hypothetical protein
MMIKTSAVMAVLLASPAMAQEVVFDFKDITNIEVRNGITVNLVQGDEIAITGTAVSGDVSQFKLQKFGNWLAVNRNTRWFIFPYGRQDELVLTVTLPNARALKAYDNASITASGFTGERLRAEALDGGTVSLTDFNFDETSLYATGDGSLTISGTCNTLEAEAILSASIGADEFFCDRATVETGSKGAVHLSTTTEIVDSLPDMAE